MSEASRSATSTQPNIIGPDFFSYYAREIADLLSQEEELLYFSPRVTDAESACKVLENGKERDLSCAKPLFSDIIADSVSGGKKELLKGLLRESLSTLNQEVDEILDPVVRLRHILSQLRSKTQQLTKEAGCKDKLREKPCKKFKAEFYSSARGMSVNGGDLKSDPGMQVDEDLKLLLENEDSLLVEQRMGKHANEYALTLQHMEQQLEAILDSATSQCRAMSRQEKQQLKLSIQKLSPKNLERVAEIITHNKPSASPSSDEVFVDLENEDNKTLWRLYFYVKAVDNARKLSG